MYTYVIQTRFLFMFKNNWIRSRVSQETSFSRASLSPSLSELLLDFLLSAVAPSTWFVQAHMRAPESSVSATMTSGSLPRKSKEELTNTGITVLCSWTWRISMYHRSKRVQVLRSSFHASQGNWGTVETETTHQDGRPARSSHCSTQAFPCQD